VILDPAHIICIPRHIILIHRQQTAAENIKNTTVKYQRMASDESDTVLALGGVANSGTHANGDVADDVPQDVNVGPSMLGLDVSGVANPTTTIACNCEKGNNYPTDNDNLAEVEDVKDDLFDASNATGMDQELGLAAVAEGERDREGVHHGSPSALESSQCVSGIIGKGDSVDGPTGSAGNEGEIQEFTHGEPICDGKFGLDYNFHLLLSRFLKCILFSSFSQPATDNQQ